MKTKILNPFFSRALSMFFAVFFLAACNKTIPIHESIMLKVDRASIKLGVKNSATINVSYEGSWVAELEDNSWCTIDNHSGTGNGAILITLKERTNPQRLITKLTIKSTSNPDLVQTVRIAMDGIDFTVDPAVIEFGLGENYYDLEVDYEGPWTAKLDNDSWCAIDKHSGTGKTTIRVTNKDDFNTASGKASKLVVSALDFSGFKMEVDVKQLTRFKHGSYLTLNKATVGKGIDVVLTGEAFVEADMGKNGKWHKTANLVMNYLFDIEPYKSFKDHFNVYMVNAVSESSTIGTGLNNSKTFYKVYKDPNLGNIIQLTGGDRTTPFVYENSPIKEDKGRSDGIFVYMIINDTDFRGVSILGQIGGIALGTTFDLGVSFRYTVIHEFSHIFGKLADEYFGINTGRISSTDVFQYITARQNFGFYQNIEFTNNTFQFFNKNWVKLLDMKYPGVGVFQGGFYYALGPYRSIEKGMMADDAKAGFGAVNREILLRQIYKLSGREAEYSFETFLEYDKRNLIN